MVKAVCEGCGKSFVRGENEEWKRYCFKCWEKVKAEKKRNPGPVSSSEVSLLLGGCTVCNRKANGEKPFFGIPVKVCEFHAPLIGILMDKKEVWERAYGEKLTPKIFLAQLVSLQETGGAAKTLCRNVLGRLPR